MPNAPPNPNSRKTLILKTKDGRYWDLADSTTSDDPILAAPHGGGFICKIPRADVADYDAALPEQYRLVTVGFEDLAVCKAHVNFEDRWNGWLQPLVDEENLRKFLESQLRLASDCYEVCTGRLDNGILHITHAGYPAGEANEAIPAQEINFAGQQVEVWPIGLGLTWELVGGPYVAVAPEQIARDFTALLLSELGPEQLAEVAIRNSREPDQNICHSHDFVDANMVMHAAFMRHDINPSSALDNGEQNQVWNTAWGIAKKANFGF